MSNDVSGGENSALGFDSLENITTGNENVAVGNEALTGYAQEQ